MDSDTIAFGVSVSIFWGLLTTIGVRPMGSNSFYLNAMFNAIAFWVVFYTAVMWKNYKREE